VRGPQRALDAATGAIEAFVDVAGLGSGRYNLRVQIDPPPDVGVANVNPQLVEVVIR
jgi:hypothetical protein